MTPFAINLSLALAWTAMFSDFTVAALATGFAIGYLILWLLQPLFGPNRYCRKLVGLLGLALFFLWELLVSSLRVAWDVITPPQKSRPGIIALPLDVDTDIEITILANLVSLTPGTLSLDLSADHKTLFVHAMFVDDPEQLRREIKNGMERRVLEALR